MDNNNLNNIDLVNKKGRLTGLPNIANDVNPVAKTDAKEIVALLKKGSDITGYKLNDGQMISIEQGVNMAKNGDIKGVAVAHKKDTVYLRSFADGNSQNNLHSLPSVALDDDQQ